MCIASGPSLIDSIQRKASPHTQAGKDGKAQGLEALLFGVRLQSHFLLAVRPAAGFLPVQSLSVPLHEMGTVM